MDNQKNDHVVLTTVKAKQHYDLLVAMSNTAAQATGDKDLDKLIADAFQSAADHYSSMLNDIGINIERGEFLVDIMYPQYAEDE